MAELPTIAVIGAGIFVKTEFIPRLSEISPPPCHLKAIWSRTEESARGAAEIAKKHFPHVESKWGDAGLDEIIGDGSITAVVVVLAAQVQVDMSLRLLKAGKHVLQEKPAAACSSEAESSISTYHSFRAQLPILPIWAVAENFRFEPSFIEGKKLMIKVGDIMNVQVIVEASMSQSNPYFSTPWRHSFNGGFTFDMGVHFIAGLRMLVGSEVASVSALTSHVDLTIPPPDNISSTFQLENGCSGVFVMVVSTRSPKILWRVVGVKGTLHVELGKHDYSVTLHSANGKKESFFYPVCGVTEEIKTFFSDISQANHKDCSHEVEHRLSYVEAARDVAILEAMLESGKRQGAPVKVKQF